MPPEETNSPNQTPATTPAAPVKPTNPVADAGQKFKEDYLAGIKLKDDDKKPEDKKPEDNKPEDKKPEGEVKPEDKKPEDNKPEDKKPEGEVPAEENNELTPEEQAYVNEAVNNFETREKVIKTLDLWSSTLTPQTTAWIEGLRNKRLEAKAQAETASKVASGQGLTEEQKNEIANLTADLRPIEFDRKANYRDNLKLEDTVSYSPEFITPEKLQKEFGLDVTKVPAKVAQAMSSIISKHNKLAANASFLFSEGKKAFTSRDQAKAQLLSHEFRQEMDRAGYDVESASMDLVMPEVKKLLHVNGVKQPWDKVLSKLTQKHPKLFNKKAAPGSPAAAAAAGAAAAGVTPAAATPPPPPPPTPTEGTRNANPNAPKPAPQPMGKKPMEEARQGFAADLERMLRNQARG